jgi:hypothetical protein
MIVHFRERNRDIGTSVDQPSLISALPDRTPLVIGQPQCVLCRELIDVWAQFVCDDCRVLSLWQFVCKYRAVAA